MAAFGEGNPLTSIMEKAGSVGLGLSTSRVNQLMDQKIQQWDRDKQGSGPNGTVTQADQQAIAREVGRDLMLQGGAQSTIPMSPEVKDVQAQQINQAMDTWRSAPTVQEQDKLLTQSLGISNAEWQAALGSQVGAPTVDQLVARNPDAAGALMAYEDSRMSAEQRDAIQQVAPWVVSGATGKYQYTETQTVSDLAQWSLIANLGDVQTLTPFGNGTTFLQKTLDERDVNNGWLQYDQLKNWEYSVMEQNGWSSQSPMYQEWNDAYFQPALVQMENEFPAWSKKFGSGAGGTSASTLAAESAPLRSLQLWEVIPQNPDFETKQSVLWRQAIQAQQQAAGQIYDLNMGGGSTIEQQMVMDQFQSILQELAAQDPTFAQQLSSYSFGKWEDIVNLQADEQLANLYATSLPGYV